MRILVALLAICTLIGGGLAGLKDPRAFTLPVLALFCLFLLWWYRDQPTSHR
jgi:hypothetical protein